ncbi:hypothetical protein KH172YL63_03980 [Bacillus sp. KH172YL63]|nr:hypothetical protein KH172YL63_03980 [Bacillus sp. KH172YL63]
MEKKKCMLHVSGIFICFIMFVLGMIFYDRSALFILMGIWGLSGASILLFRLLMKRNIGEFIDK